MEKILFQLNRTIEPIAGHGFQKSKQRTNKRIYGCGSFTNGIHQFELSQLRQGGMLSGARAIKYLE